MVVFPKEEIGAVSSMLYLPGTAIFAGFLAAWMLKLRGAGLRLVCAFALYDLCAELLLLFWEAATFRSEAWLLYGRFAIGWLYLLIGGVLLWRSFSGLRSRWRRGGAILLVVLTYTGAATLIGMDGAFWRLSAYAQASLGTGSIDEAGEENDRPPEMEADRLWEAQPKLVDTAIAKIRPRVSGKMNVYTLSVAASGAQALFSREAHKADEVLSGRFDVGHRGGVLLSNGAADFLRFPLATRASIAAATDRIGAVADRQQDLVILYLASHGGRDAELESDLPNYNAVQPISASFTAQALKHAGINRRIVIISACYAATWIPALANDDTIVIAAAAKDRTSFGCDDSRDLTYFGDAFLKGSFARGTSLKKGFDDAKKTIAKWERDQKLTPSMPQVYVGRNMKTLWETSVAKPARLR